MKIHNKARVVKPPKLVLGKFRGCVLGVAIGDALGAPLEGMTRRQIQSAYGRVDGYVRNPSKPKLNIGQWTDDTALTLATLRSIVETHRVDIGDISFKMRTTYVLEPYRGYGLTTREALEGKAENRKNAGNGAAMRIAPMALFSYLNFDELRENVTEASRITHTNPEAVNGAMAVAFAMASAVQDELKPNSIIQQTIDFLGATTEMSYKLREVQDILNNSKVSTQEGLEYIGTRGYVLESVGSAFYSYLKTPNDFRESVTQAINAGGDTDTIGSLTGAISGSFNGIEGIPRKWLNKLEARGELDEFSRRLHRVVNN